MAKIYGLFGSMTGKMADTVMSVRNGVQLVRKYQPVVYNPQTEGQVAARARLKLMSQLAAVMARNIAIPREGIVSARNLFVKKNYRLSSYADSTASITLANVQLTDSVVSLPALTAVRAANAINVELSQAASDLDRVVYVLFAKADDGTLRFIRSEVIAKTAGSVFQTELTTPNVAEVLYAYGLRDNTAQARTVFGNMQALSAETVAKLLAERVLTLADVTLTETRGVEVPMQQ